MYKFQILILHVFGAWATGGVEAFPFAYCSSCTGAGVITGSSAVSDSCNRRVRYSCDAFLYVREQSFDGESDEDEDDSCDWEADTLDASSAILKQQQHGIRYPIQTIKQYSSWLEERV